MARGSARAKELYENRGQRAKELRGDSKKVMGYICCFPPTEPITSLTSIGGFKTRIEAFLEMIG